MKTKNRIKVSVLHHFAFVGIFIIALLMMSTMNHYLLYYMHHNFIDNYLDNVVVPLHPWNFKNFTPVRRFNSWHFGLYWNDYTMRILHKCSYANRMLIGNFGKSLVCSEALAPFFKNSHIGSFFSCKTKAYCYQCWATFLDTKCLTGLEDAFPAGCRWKDCNSTVLLKVALLWIVLMFRSIRATALHYQRWHLMKVVVLDTKTEHFSALQ